jgi:hypothetical protein
MMMPDFVYFLFQRDPISSSLLQASLSPPPGGIKRPHVKL